MSVSMKSSKAQMYSEIERLREMVAWQKGLIEDKNNSLKIMQARGEQHHAAALDTTNSVRRLAQLAAKELSRHLGCLTRVNSVGDVEVYRDKVWVLAKEIH